MVNRLGAARSNNFAQEVTTKSIGLRAGFSVIVTVPKEELAAGHSYAAVITGTCGAFYHPVPSNPFFAAQITGLVGSTNYLFNGPLLHQQHGNYANWKALWDPFNKRWVNGLRGLPFQIILKFTMPTPAEDFHVIARMLVNAQNHPTGKFLIENATALLWDLTEIAAAPGTDAFTLSYTGPVIRIPFVNQSLVRPLTGTPGTAGTWLVYHSALLTGANPQSNDRIGLDNTSTQKFDMPIGVSSYGARVPLHSTIWQGQQGVRDLGGTEKLSQWLHGFYAPGPPQGYYHLGEILAIRLHADQQFFRWPPDKSTTLGFWNAAYQGIPIGPVDFTVSYSSDYWFFGTAGTGPIPNAAMTPIIEVDGGEFRHVSVHGLVGQGPVANAQICRVEHSGQHNGTFRGRLWGEAYWEDLNRFNGQLGRDPQLYGFGLRANYVPPADPEESKGPIAVVVPGRETSLAVGSLPELPSPPSYSFSVDMLNQLREFQTARGDMIASPKFLKARRIFRFVWNGLDQTEGAQLAAFFEGLRASSGGTFRWRLPGEFADLAFTLDGDSFRSQPGTDLSTYSVSFDALELVFVVP